MSNIFLSPLQYITIAEYQESTTSNLKTHDHEEIHVYIGKAEVIIGDIAEIPQTIPLDVKKAVVLLTDAIYTNRDILDTLTREVLSETQRGNSVTYAKDNSPYRDLHPLITQEIYIYLKPYLKKDPTQKSEFYYFM